MTVEDLCWGLKKRVNEHGRTVNSGSDATIARPFINIQQDTLLFAQQIARSI
jgi:hypothetical protein